MSAELFKFRFNKPMQAADGPSVESQFVMDDSAFKGFRDVIYKQSGIYYSESKKFQLEGRIYRRITEGNFNNYDEYLNLVSSPSGSQELHKLLDVITLSESSFFRSPQQIDAYQTVIAPQILKAKPSGEGRVFRIWSAASATGEEPYTLAMLTIEKLKPLYPDVRFQILASDINNSAIEDAKRGVYQEHSISDMPKEYLEKYFTHNGSNYVINDEVKKLVKFIKLNLYDSAAVRSVTGCDVIFCCNVLVFFDPPSRQVVISNLYNSLARGGYLFIGYSESLHGITKAFKLVHLPRAMAYKKE